MKHKDELEKAAKIVGVKSSDLVREIEVVKSNFPSVTKYFLCLNEKFYTILSLYKKIKKEHEELKKKFKEQNYH